MSMNFIQRLITGGQDMVNRTMPTQQPAYLPVPVRARNYNPFISAMDTESAEYRENYGVNRPLAKPMFFGYRDNQALYGGSRLFILY